MASKESVSIVTLRLESEKFEEIQPSTFFTEDKEISG